MSVNSKRFFSLNKRDDNAGAESASKISDQLSGIIADLVMKKAADKEADGYAVGIRALQSELSAAPVHILKTEKIDEELSYFAICAQDALRLGYDELLKYSFEALEWGIKYARRDIAPNLANKAEKILDCRLDGLNIYETILTLAGAADKNRETLELTKRRLSDYKHRMKEIDELSETPEYAEAFGKVRIELSADPMYCPKEGETLFEEVLNMLEERNNSQKQIGALNDIRKKTIILIGNIEASISFCRTAVLSCELAESMETVPVKPLQSSTMRELGKMMQKTAKEILSDSE